MNNSHLWYVVIKPDAIQLWVSTHIIDLLKNKEDSILYNKLQIENTTKENLHNIFLKDIINIPQVLSNDLVSILYKDCKDLRYYKYLIKEYNKDMIICILNSTLNYKYLYDTLKKLKWRSHVIDKNWNTIYWPRGIRWYFMSPRNFISDDDLNSLDENEYSNTVQLFTQNLLHTTDSINDTEALNRRIITNI